MVSQTAARYPLTETESAGAIGIGTRAPLTGLAQLRDGGQSGWPGMPVGTHHDMCLLAPAWPKHFASRRHPGNVPPGLPSWVPSGGPDARAAGHHVSSEKDSNR